jgi:hypothetical protein
MSLDHLNPRIISFTELKQLHPNSSWVKLMSNTWITRDMEKEKASICYFDHDITIEGDLNIDPDSGLYNKYALIFVAGNLNIKGVLRNFSGNYGIHIGITGNIIADAIIAGGSHIHVDGNGLIKYFIYGHYNDGAIQIHGNTQVPLIICDEEHDMGFNHSESTVWAECFCGMDEEGIFVEEVKKMADGEKVIDVNRILDFYKSGKNPLAL